MYNKHLDAFLMAADCGSFTKAAEKLFISPNALIKQINLLEDRLELTLFLRTNHGVVLTRPARAFIGMPAASYIFRNKHLSRQRRSQRASRTLSGWAVP